MKLLEDKHKLKPNNAITTQLKNKCSGLDKLLTEEIERSFIFTNQKHYDRQPNSIKVLACKLKKQTCKSYITK